MEDPHAASKPGSAGSEARAGSSPPDEGQLDNNCNLVDEEPYTFFDSLLSRVQNKLAIEQDPEIQTELALLLRLAISLGDRLDANQRAQFRAAFELLSVDQPNLIVVKSIRVCLELHAAKAHSGLAAVIIRLAGPVPITAVLAGLVSMFLLLTTFLIALALSYPVLMEWDTEQNSIFHHFLSLVGALPTVEILEVIAASFLGSVISVLTRIQTFTASAVFRPISLFTSTFFRPIISIAFALFIYSVMKSGIVSFFGVSFTGPKAGYFIWIISFLAGFSERFAGNFISQSESRFGGAPNTQGNVGTESTRNDQH